MQARLFWYASCISCYIRYSIEDLMEEYHKEQSHFLHNSDVQMEHFAREIFGERYYGTAGCTEMRFYKKLYLETLKLIGRSFEATVGTIDQRHRQEICCHVRKMQIDCRKARLKDDIHVTIIVGLFRLVFLLLGSKADNWNLRRNASVVVRSNAFRTLTYVQNPEQQQQFFQIEVKKKTGDAFYGDPIYSDWLRQSKTTNTPRSYVDWVRVAHPDLYLWCK